MTDFLGLSASGAFGTKSDSGSAADGETAHAFLRRVTRPLHDGVEAAFERFDLQSIEGLSGFLLGQAHALLPLEHALEAAAIETLLPDWRHRRRAPCLIEDLARLGLARPEPSHSPKLGGTVQQLGMLYVLEGSKLGGRVLHRRVLSSTDPHVRAADAFLGHHYPRGWASFLSILNAVAADPADRDGLKEGAVLAFASFRLASQRATPSHAMPPRGGSDLYPQARA